MRSKPKHVLSAGLRAEFGGQRMDNFPERTTQEETAAGLRVLVIFLTLVTAVVAVSSQSLWIDEANAAEKAIQPTLAAFWNALREQRGSDSHMPLYMLYLWAWEKIAGSSEWALRAGNLPFFFLIQATWIWGLGRGRIGWLAAGITCLFPMIWIYLDEARPYLMQFFGASLMLTALCRMGEGQKPGESNWPLLVLFTGMVIASGSSLLGIPFAGMALLCALGMEMRRGVIPCLKKWGKTPALWVTGLVFAVMGSYYAWTFMGGSRASTSGGTGLNNLFFACYEILGFSGLGPGRIMIREEGFSAFLPFLVPLCLLAMGWFFLSFQIVKRKPLSGLVCFSFVAYALVSCLFIFLLGKATGFRVLGRHLTPVAPVLVLVLAFVLDGRLRFARAAVLWILLGWTVSDLSHRFIFRHAKDDYRNAARFAHQEVEKGGTVFWAADPAGAKYYGVNPSASSGPVLQTVNLTSEQAAALPEPGLIVLSKTDLYDAREGLRKLLEGGKWKVAARFQAFTLYEKQGINGSAP